MAIIQLACPACTAPLTIPDKMERLVCAFCGSTLQVQGDGSQAALRRIDKVMDSLRQSSDLTHAELRRMQLAQELSTARMQLGQIEGEIRAITRATQTHVSRRQLNELQKQADPLRRRVAELERTLNPEAAATQPVAAKSLSFSREYLIWLLLSWRGRLSRAGFWLGMAVTFVLFLLIGALAPDPAQGEAAGNPLIALLLLLAMWIGTCVAIKRLHDRDKPGWWVLIGMIPMVGLIYLFVELGLLPGTPGPNQYG